ncbi:MAG TPA: N-methyl-L-tryptophan oxidase [Gemmatimonadaceae bacterium]
MTTTNYDVIVVGLGAMGSATLYPLARRGVKVLGLDQGSFGHHNGSSHGDTRIIREAYFEHPLYVPLVQRAYELWRELENLSEKRLMTITGGLMIGPPDGSVVTGTLNSARAHQLRHEVLDADEIHRRYPEFRPVGDLVAVVDPHAGFLDPELSMRIHLELAERAGAVYHFEERVESWRADANGVSVETPRGSYSADRLLIACGPWSRDITPDLELPLLVERQTVFWFEGEASAAAYNVETFPIYAYEYIPGNIVYGFPRQSRGVKASVMHAGKTAQSERSVRDPVDPRDVGALRHALEPILPDLARAKVRESATCLFTNTPDHDFIIDFHPHHPQVLISSPCSGHGFKFASAIGEVQADLLTTRQARFDLAPFRIARFSKEA